METMMKTILRAVLAVAVLGICAGQAVAAPIHSPAGIWITNGGESKYELTLCGDGDDLCAKMIWANDSELGQKLKPYLGTEMLVNAPRIANQVWRGKMNVQGNVVRGNIELRDANNIHIKGCNGAVCQTVELIRVSD
jgi:uncharacterized protein (DUF2147 family)